MARNFDLLLALLPFEPPFFEKYGLHTVFVGHPVIERANRMTGGAALRARLGIAPDAPLLCVLPGSRSSEIRFILPIFRDAVAEIAKRVPGLVTILPTVPHVAARVRAATENWPAPLHIVENEADKFAAFDAANAALAASGTVTTELALARTPMVVAYRVGGLTYALAQVLFRFKFFALVNLLLDREAVPELLQGKATPAALADAIVPLLTDKPAAAKQTADLDEVAKLLGEGSEPPSCAPRARLWISCEDETTRDRYKISHRCHPRRARTSRAREGDAARRGSPLLQNQAPQSCTFTRPPFRDMPQHPRRIDDIGDAQAPGLQRRRPRRRHRECPTRSSPTICAHQASRSSTIICIIRSGLPHDDTAAR